MKTNGNDPINPCKGHDREFMDKIHSGLSKREYFAAMAMQGLLSKGSGYGKSLCNQAVEHADFLIESLNNHEPQRKPNTGGCGLGERLKEYP